MRFAIPNHTNKILIHSFIIAIMIFIVSCASTDNENLKSINSICAISLLGDKLTIHVQGTNSHSQNYRFVNVENWRIDEFAENEIYQALKNNEKFEFTHLSGKLNGFMNIYEECSDCLGRAPEYDINRIRDRIIELKRIHSIDAVIFILKADNFHERISGENISIQGTNYGLDRRYFMGTKLTAVHTFANVIFVETRKASILTQFKIMQEYFIQNDHWSFNYNDLPDGSKELIESKIKKQIQVGLKNTLQELKLI